MEEQLKEFAKKFIDAYFIHLNADWIIAQLDEDIVWRGFCGYDTLQGIEEVTNRLKKFLNSKKGRIFHITRQKYRVNSFNANLFAVHIYIDGSSQQTKQSDVEYSFLFSIQLFRVPTGLKVSTIRVEPLSHKNDKRYAASVKNAVDKLNIMTQFMKCGLVVTRDDEDYSIVKIDREVCEIFGYQKKELLEKCGNQLSQLIYPPDYKQVVAKIAMTLLESNDYSTKYRVQRSDGQIVWVSDVGYRMLDHDGKPVVRRLIADINQTELIRIERNATFESIPGGVAYLQIQDDDFEVVDANDNYFQMLGTKRELYINSGIRYTYPDDLPKLRDHLVHVAMDKLPVDIEFRVEKPRTKEIHWYHMIGRYFSDEPTGIKYIVFMTDSTERHEALASLAREKDRYRIAMRSSADVVFEYEIKSNELFLYFREEEAALLSNHKDGRVDHWEKALFESQIIHPDDVGKILAVFDMHHSYTSEVRILNTIKEEGEEKEYTLYRFQATAIYEEEYKTRVIGLLQNINEQEQLRSSNEELKQIFDLQLIQNYERIVKLHVPTKTYIQYSINANTFFENVPTGLHEDAMQRIAYQYVHRDDRERYLDSMKLKHMNQLLCSGEQEVVRYFRLLSETGKYRWKSYRYSFLGVDMDYIVISVQDVHEMMEEQRQEEEANRRILLDAVSEANKASEAHQNFLSMVTQEVRSPLESLQNMAKLKKSELSDPSKVEETLNSISNTSKYLTSIVNEMAEMEQLEKGKLRFVSDQFNLHELLQEVCQNQKKNAEEDKIILEAVIRISSRRVYYGDAFRIRQILSNILANAIKFSPVQEKVRFIAKEQKYLPGQTLLVATVEDRGVSIDPEYFERVYDQEDETEYEQRVLDAEGTGFSLTLCKMIAQLMGGKAQISHGNRELNRFTVEIPLHYEGTKSKVIHGKESAKPEESAKPIVDLSPYRILLVENNTKDNKLTGPFLRINGAQVTITYSLAEAVSAWKNSSDGYYSMILTDCNYQDGSCWDLGQMVRKSSRKDSRKMAIVVMSETVLVDDIKRGFRQGINANIPKPVDLKRILQILEVFKGGNSLC